MKAQTGSFVVALRSGENVEFLLSERPKLTFTDGVMTIATPYVQSEFDLSEIERTEFTGVSGVESIENDGANAVVFDLATAPGHVLVSGCKSASVYDISGKLVFDARQADGEVIDFDMSSLHPGVYVIYTPVRSIKYSKQ